jgi:peptidoglycan/xylan/chitin deacetylase (PgdA/CDA1 family)
MISITYEDIDPLSSYGMDHFIGKFGIPVKEGTGLITIAYGKTELKNSGFLIKILKNSIEKEIQGWVKTKDGEIPIFEMPFEYENQGEALATFHGKDVNYPCILSDDYQILFTFDVFREIGHILSGGLEGIWNSKKEEKVKISKVPIVDCLEKILLDCIVLACERRKVPLVRKTMWPYGGKFALCLTHDVDRVHKTYQYFTHLIKHLIKGNFSFALNQIKSLFEKLDGNDPYWNFEKIMNLEKRFDVRSTFFILNEEEKPRPFDLKSWVLFSGRYRINDPKIIKILKEMHENGWEIGVHGSYYSYADKLRLGREKDEIEALIGDGIGGVRQHYLNLEIPRTWRLQEEVGFKYDSTLCVKDDVGFRWGTCFPFHPFDSESGKKLGLLEIPLIIIDGSVFKKRDAWKECEEIIDIVEKFGGVLTVLWHQRAFNENEFQGWSEVYEKLVRTCIRKNAWITTADKIESWWNSRWA